MIRPVSRALLVSELVGWLAASQGPVRIAVDGPPCADPSRLVDELDAPLRAAGRRLEHVRAELFWRDASLRFEQGREDVDSYLDWLDAGALRREVLDPPDRYLPSLRDPESNRATRAARLPVTPASVIAVSGSFLLGLGLPFDAAVHLAMTPAARARRTPPEDAWTLAAFARYDEEVDPASLADVVIRCDDPARPAVSGLGTLPIVRRANYRGVPSSA